MNINEALAVVIDLAQQNALDPTCDIIPREMVKEARLQQHALIHVCELAKVLRKGVRT